MNKLNTFIAKLKFKKLVIVYLVVLIVAGVACAAVTGVIFKDKLSFAWQYSRISESFEKASGSDTSLQSKLKNLAASSGDVVDILILDSENNVTYSANGSEFGKATQFNLSRTTEEKSYLVSETNPDVVFHFVKGDEFMLTSVFNNTLDDVGHDYEDDSFYQNGFNNKTVYLLGYLGNRDTGERIYYIKDSVPVANGELVLEIDAAAVMFFFMLYWVLLALGVYQNALKAKMHAVYWGIVVLITNLAGFLVYVLYKRSNATCLGCGSVQNKLNLYCPSCGEKMRESCADCGALLDEKDAFCPHCGKKLK